MPIRTLVFSRCFVGSDNSGVGGIHSSTDSGQSWSLDVDTGVEMAACAGTARDYESTAQGQGRGQEGGGKCLPVQVSAETGVHKLRLTGVLVSAGSMIVTCVGSAKGKPSKILSTLIELG